MCWKGPIQMVANLHTDLLNSIADPQDRFDRLCQLNVAEQVLNVGSTTIVQGAWSQGRQLFVHGWIYGLKDGLVRDLDITINNVDGLRRLRNDYLTGDKRQVAEPASN